MTVVQQVHRARVFTVHGLQTLSCIFIEILDILKATLFSKISPPSSENTTGIIHFVAVSSRHDIYLA